MGNSHLPDTEENGHIRVSLALITVIAAVLASMLFSQSFVCYAVSIGGSEIGKAASREALISAIDEAETTASDIIGTHCDVTEDMTVTAGISLTSDSAEDLSERIVENLSGIVRQYAVVIDGVAVARNPDESALRDVLSDILEEYTTDSTVSAGFKQDVVVELRNVSEELESDPETIASILSPSNALSKYSLTVTVREVTQQVGAIECETEVLYDDEMYSDEQYVLQTGQDGSYCATVTVIRENGEIVSSDTTEYRVLAEATTRVITQGTLSPELRKASIGTYIWPAEGTLSSFFGPRTPEVGSTMHKGLDIANSIGTQVFAADGGEVVFASYWDGSGYGNLVEILHDNGDVTYYGHLSEILVSVGDRVAQGDLIAEMGATGNVSGSHLHFEIRPGGGEPVDPLNYLP